MPVTAMLPEPGIALAALIAGGSVAVTIAALLGVGELPVPPVAALSRTVRRLTGSRDLAAMRLGWPWLDGPRLLWAEIGATVLAGALAYRTTELPALGAAGAGLGLGCVRIGLAWRATALREARQDAVLEAVRSLRQLLETGGVSVAGALEVLAVRGPTILRRHFQSVSQAAGPGPQARAWASAREAVAEPVFDLLSAAVLIQRPAGGELAPLFRDLEEAVTAVHEVEREAEALQVQARSAAALILALPLAFLVVLSALRSPYLDPYRTPVGEAFLVLMLAAMGSSYLWIRHWLRLPAEPRIRLRDA